MYYNFPILPVNKCLKASGNRTNFLSQLKRVNEQWTKLMQVDISPGGACLTLLSTASSQELINLDIAAYI